MTPCAVCKQQHSGRPVTLFTGQTVCDYSEAWRLECEARHVLTYPLEKRREYLASIEKRRGAKYTDKLKDLIRRLFYVTRNSRG